MGFLGMTYCPMGESETKFTVEESRDYLVNHFRRFSDELQYDQSSI